MTLAQLMEVDAYARRRQIKLAERLNYARINTPECDRLYKLYHYTTKYLASIYLLAREIDVNLKNKTVGTYEHR